KTVLIIGGIVAAIVAVLVFVSKYQEANRPVASEALFRQDSHTKGLESAKIQLIEFGDFQCPSCAQAETTVRQIMTDYPEQVKFTYRHFPLSFHQHANITAQASEAAALQGKFWEMHDLIFDNQAVWSAQNNIEDTLIGYAEQLEMD